MRRREFIAALGGAVVSPLVARAQAMKSYRLGYLALLPGEDTTLAKPLLQRLQELGYRKGVNMILEYRSADGRAERLPQLAAELVRAGPDVLIAGYGTLAPKAAIAATSSIPIVFTSVGDPVGAGLIASLSQPGANATGLSAQASDITAKRLQFLEDLIPGKKLVAVLGNPDTPYTALALQEVRTAGQHGPAPRSLRSQNRRPAANGYSRGDHLWSGQYAGAGGSRVARGQARNHRTPRQGPAARDLWGERLR